MDKLPLTLTIPETRELQDKIVKRVVELRDQPPALYDDRANLQRLREKVSSELFYKADSHEQEVTLTLTAREVETLQAFLEFELDRSHNERLNRVNAELWDSKHFVQRRK